MERDPLLSRWDEVDAIFTAAMELAPGERLACVESRCGGDRELRDAVISLLASAVEAEGFLENAGIVISASLPRGWAEEAEEELPAAGEQVGAYRLVREIGRGGAGTVYLAERADGQFTQRAAIKLLRRGLDTDDILARFRAERQILASLNHPNIARLLDGGATADGRPYLIMEVVEGQPITEYCDARRLTVEERLRLFITVARAVQHAHRNLVVHRDIKPSNILVSDDGTVKLLDFGIAKLLDDSAETASTPTRTGYRLMTPEYASPEQVHGEPVTTATDVYQLGVLLYQLLSGRHPHRRLGSTPMAVERAITEEEPLPPSAAVARGSEEIAHLRRTEPRWLRMRLRGDLDMVVTMALRKEPDRRYDSVVALLEDVERHLSGRPVAARGDAWGYSAFKFVRRRPGAVAAGVAVVLTAGGYTGTLQTHAERLEYERNLAQVEWQRAEAAQQSAEAARRLAEEERQRVQLERDRVDNERQRAEAAQASAEAERIRAEAERDRAEEALQRARVETEKAEQVTSFLAGLFEQADPARAMGEDLTVRQVLDRGVEQADRLPADPEVRAELLTVMTRVYGALGLYDQALPLARQALELRRERFGEDHAAVAQSMSNLAAAQWDEGDQAGAEQLYRQTLTMQQRLLGEEHLETARTLQQLGRILSNKRDLPAAEQALRQALAVQRRLLGEEHLEVARSLQYLGIVLTQNGDADAAEQALRQSLAMQEKLHGGDHLEMVPTTYVLGELLGVFRKDTEGWEQWLRRGLAIQRSLLGEEHPEIAQQLARLASMLGRTGNPDGAAATLRQALAMQRKLLGGEHPDVAATLSALGIFLHQKGDFAEGEQVYREGLAIIQSAIRAGRLDEDDSLHHFTLHNLGTLLLARRDFPAAAEAHRGALAVRRRRFGEQSQPVAMSLRNVGLALHGGEDLPAAESYLRESLVLWRQLVGAEHIRTAEGARYLGVLLGERGEYDEAESLLREAVATHARLLGQTHPAVVGARNELRDLLLARRDHAAAAALQ